MPARAGAVLHGHGLRIAADVPLVCSELCSVTMEDRAVVRNRCAKFEHFGMLCEPKAALSPRRHTVVTVWKVTHMSRGVGARERYERVHLELDARTSETSSGGVRSRRGPFGALPDRGDARVAELVEPEIE